MDLPALLKTLDFDRMAAGVNFPAHGARSLPVDFKNVSGLPTSLVFGRQIFAMSKGRSVVPHGHDNMATGFLILKGTFRGRHYDRVEDHKDHYIIRPTIDRTFTPGECSTISDHKDNVHWFTAESDTAFIFNIHVNDTDPGNPKRPGRVYVDPLGEKLAGGLVKAPKITLRQGQPDVRLIPPRTSWDAQGRARSLVVSAETARTRKGRDSLDHVGQTKLVGLLGWDGSPPPNRDRFPRADRARDRQAAA